MRRFVSLAVALAAVALTAGCSGDGLTGPIVETPLTCEDGGAPSTCELELVAGGGFAVELLSTECRVDNSTIEVTAPVADVLTTDGCDEDAGTTWTYVGPYAAGTKIVLTMSSKRFADDPLFVVGGDYPTWSVKFEDGADNDRNDIVLEVRALTP